jgi:serine/threonine protein kinase
MTWISDRTVAHLREVAERPALDSHARYEILDLLGRGGMSTVYLAHDRTLDRPVAFKVLATDVMNAGGAARLEQEARILARLEHPGIVPVYDLGALDDGRIFCVMKRVEGPTLETYELAGRPLADRLALFVRICEPVAFAHARGVVHRDLKPANVMAGLFGEVLVMDWGVARLMTGESADDAPRAARRDVASGTATAHGVMIGTPDYMAPEQARGEPVGPRADVFALGGILHFLFAGGPPGRTVFNGPRPLQAICTRSRAPDPAERYGSVEDLMADVRSFAAGEPVAAYPEGLVLKAARLYRKHQTAVLLVLGYLLMRVILLLATND